MSPFEFEPTYYEKALAAYAKVWTALGDHTYRTCAFCMASATSFLKEHGALLLSEEGLSRCDAGEALRAEANELNDRRWAIIDAEEGRSAEP